MRRYWFSQAAEAASPKRDGPCVFGMAPRGFGDTGPLPWAELGHIATVLQPQLLT